MAQTSTMSFSAKVQREFERIVAANDGLDLRCSFFHDKSDCNLFDSFERRGRKPVRAAKRKAGRPGRRRFAYQPSCGWKFTRCINYCIRIRRGTSLLEGFSKSLRLHTKAAILMIAERSVHSVYDRCVSQLSCHTQQSDGSAH